VANILSDAKKQQVIALGQLGWTLRRIEEATGVRRETASTLMTSRGRPGETLPPNRSRLTQRLRQSVAVP
jgi:hypothetical protein